MQEDRTLNLDNAHQMQSIIPRVNHEGESFIDCEWTVYTMSALSEAG